MKGTITADFRFHRDQFGAYIPGSGTFGPRQAPQPGHMARINPVNTTRGIVWAMMRGQSRKALFDAAWRKALADEQIEPSMRIFETDSPSALISEAENTARILDAYISEMVNNPKSKFYIHG